MDPYVRFQKGITKSCDHPLPSTTSHNFTASTHNQPRPAITLLPAPTTTHNLSLFLHHHPRLYLLLYYFIYYYILLLSLFQVGVYNSIKINKNQRPSLYKK